MRFTSIIALPLFSLFAAAVQLHASPAASSVAPIQRRQADVTTYTYLLQGDEDSVGLNDITCSSGTASGQDCYNNVQTALIKAVGDYVVAVDSWLNPSDSITGAGSVYGFDGDWDLVATIYYNITEGDPDSSTANSFRNYGNINDMAYTITNYLYSQNVIKICTAFYVNSGGFIGNTIVVMMGWNGQAYYADPGTLQNWQVDCTREQGQ